MRFSSKKLLQIFLVLAVISAQFLFGSSSQAAEGASLQFSPSSGTFFLGSTFNVSLTLNTGEAAVNALEVQVKFPPDKLQVASPSIGTSFISIWVTPPSYSNTEGTLTFRGGVPNPGIITSNGVISTATFRARDTGEAELEYIVTSQVLANDGKGTNILKSRGIARFTIVIPPPEGPEVFSPTQPDPNVWYKKTDAAFFWKSGESVDGFSYALSQDPFETPDEISEGVNTSATFSNILDGIWYFHIRSHVGDVWGGVTHYLIRTDRGLPAAYTLSIIPKGPLTPLEHPLVTFFTTDETSGMDHYEVRIAKLSGEEESRSVSFFTEETSPFAFPVVEPGTYQVVVRAFDRAGNTRDSLEKIELTPPQPQRFTKDGFRVYAMIIRWTWAYLFLGLLLLLLLFLVWLLRHKHYTREEELQKNLTETEEKLLQEYQEMYQRVRTYRTAPPIDESSLPPPPPPQ
ncbi:MAG: cohesin domain-containing protein [bacterium]|nr:cohesin domain-containing protein [bacterium]